MKDWSIRAPRKFNPPLVPEFTVRVMLFQLLPQTMHSGAHGRVRLRRKVFGTAKRIPADLVFRQFTATSQFVLLNQIPQQAAKLVCASKRFGGQQPLEDCLPVRRRL